MSQPPSKSILILGAYGFIGNQIAKHLVLDGHNVNGFGRNIEYGQAILPDIEWMKGDLADYCSAAKWLPLLENIDIVVNASGILQSGPADDINVTQSDAIIALIEACETANIKQVIQISACGASTGSTLDFMSSKAAADERLLASSIDAAILRPGLVIGRNSYGGTEFIRMIAATPGIAPKLSGFGTVQTIALSEVVEAVQVAIDAPDGFSGSFDLVERKSRALDQIIAMHRKWLGFGPTRFHIPVGNAVMRLGALASDAIGWLGWRSPMRSNALNALINGVAGDAAQTARILGRHAMPLERTLAGFHSGKQDRIHARLMLLLPIFMLMLIFLWLGSGILGFAMANEAAALLDNASTGAGAAKLMVYGGATIDIMLGLGLMIRKTARLALAGTIIVTIAYLVGGSILTPQLWLDPLAPLIKALAAMGLSISCLIALDKR
ncbi:MAG: SDR family oxidoreductase [Sphingorhabdus sp.]